MSQRINTVIDEIIEKLNTLKGIVNDNFRENLNQSLIYMKVWNNILWMCLWKKEGIQLQGFQQQKVEKQKKIKELTKNLNLKIEIKI